MKSLALLFLLCRPLSAQTLVDDSDLAGRKSQTESADASRRIGGEGLPQAGALVFPLIMDAPVRRLEASNLVVGSVVLFDRSGAEHPGRLARVRLEGPGASRAWADADASGRFSLAAPGAGSYQVRISLDNKFWAYNNPRTGSAYEWESPAFTVPAGSGADVGALKPAFGSENAKLGVLHLTYLDALDFLKREGDVAWWDKTLTINWPGSADFFSPWAWSLDLTDATHWDIVLHELGHAVQHGAMNARAAGGEHKIDQCYSAALAWSEGWATFFAAAVRLSRDDADAKFEFLVPRRAPIRIENVPADVCKSEESEWRVSSALWDLIDTHDDGTDRFAMPFTRLWGSLRGQSMGSMTSAWALISKGMDPRELRGGEDALIQNTILPPRQPLTVSLPSAPVNW